MKRRPDPLVRDVFDAYLLAVEAAGNLAPGTLEVLAHARRYLVAAAGSRRSSEVGRPFADELLAAWTAAGLRASTARNRLRKVGTAWRWAMDRGMVSIPWVGPSRARARASAPAQGKRPYRVEELGRLLLALPEPYALPARLLSETGQRSSEVLALDHADAWREPDGWWLRVSDAKSGTPRDVPVLSPTAALLDLGRGHGPIFVTGTGARLTTRQLGGGVRRALEAAGMLTRVGPESAGRSYSLDVHGIRRSFSDHAERASIDAQVICDLAGWTRASMQQRYRRGSTTPERLREAVEALSEWRREAWRGAQALVSQGRPCPHGSNTAHTQQELATRGQGQGHGRSALRALELPTRTRAGAYALCAVTLATALRNGEGLEAYVVP